MLNHRILFMTVIILIAPTIPVQRTRTVRDERQPVPPGSVGLPFCGTGFHAINKSSSVRASHIRETDRVAIPDVLNVNAFLSLDQKESRCQEANGEYGKSSHLRFVVDTGTIEYSAQTNHSERNFVGGMKVEDGIL